MIRIKTSTEIDKFYKCLSILYLSIPQNEKHLLDPIINSKNQIGIILDSLDKFSIDVTLSSFLVLCNLWSKKLGSKIDILHDDSKQIAHYNDYIGFAKNIDMETREVGYDSRTMTFPAQINSLDLVSSSITDSVQISDLIASSLAFMYSNRNEKQNKFVESIQNSKLLNLSNSFVLWPSEKVTPIQLNIQDGKGENILDFIANERLKRE